MRLKQISINYANQLFNALGEEARIRIINILLQHNELCISDLELILDYTQTKTSRHVTFLKHADLLNYRKIDQWILYSIKPEIRTIINSIFYYFESDKMLKKDLEIAETLKSNRELKAYQLINKKRKTLDL
jgi:ArsR family transcriptional regulator, arsenate/arsenite/antimonite-responsive transcriptional repressor